MWGQPPSAVRSSEARQFLHDKRTRENCFAVYPRESAKIRGEKTSPYPCRRYSTANSNPAFGGNNSATFRSRSASAEGASSG